MNEEIVSSADKLCREVSVRPPDTGGDWRRRPSSPSAEGGYGRSAGKGEELSIERVINAYRRYAPVYDWMFGRILQPGRRALVNAVHQLRAERVLEVGVGTGLTLDHYPSDCQVVGIDVCEEMLALARARATALRGRRIDLDLMDGESLSYPDATFDCVTVPYVLSVTPDPGRLIAEIRRVCRKDGAILILNHFSGSRFWRFFEAAVRPAADKVGFRSDFAFEPHILGYDWQITSVKRVNLFGLSRLVAIRNV